MATDLRASVSLVIAALAAEGGPSSIASIISTAVFERCWEGQAGRCGAAIERYGIAPQWLC